MKKGMGGILIILILMINVIGIINAENESSTTIPVTSGVGGGGATVPVISTEITDQGTDYHMKPGRLKFEFNEKLYAIQVRKIHEEDVTFLIMTLDMDRQEDITAYTVDNSFNLKPNEKEEIDLDKDGINDVLIELNEIISAKNSIRSADFSIKKINTKEPEENDEKEIEIQDVSNPGEKLINNTKVINPEEIEKENNNTEIINLSEIRESETQEPVLEPVLASNQKPKEPTFWDKIISWIKELFE